MTLEVHDGRRPLEHHYGAVYEEICQGHGPEHPSAAEDRPETGKDGHFAVAAVRILDTRLLRTDLLDPRHTDVLGMVTDEGEAEKGEDHGYDAEEEEHVPPPYGLREVDEGGGGSEGADVPDGYDDAVELGEVLLVEPYRDYLHKGDVYDGHTGRDEDLTHGKGEETLPEHRYERTQIGRAHV